MKPVFKRWRRQHLISIMHYMKSFMLLLLVPLARGLVALLSGGFAAWLSGAWIDLLALFVMVFLAVLMWLLCTYRVKDGVLEIKSGVFMRDYLSVPIDKIVTVCAVRAFYLRPVGAVELRGDTRGGRDSAADFSLYLPAKETLPILERRLQAERGDGIRSYRPHDMYILALSAFSSSFSTGIIFLATLVSKTGQLLGDELSERVAGTFESLMRSLAFGIPPAAAAVGYIMLLGWLVAFLINFVRHKNFLLRRAGETLHVTSGIFTIREYSIAMDRVNYLDVRRTVLSCIMKFCTVSLNATGYAKHSDDVTGVIPAVKREELGKTISMFFPEYRIKARELSHNKGALFKFIGDPFWSCAGLPLAAIILAKVFPGWAGFVYWVGLLLSIPAYWFLIIRLIDYFSAGMSRDGELLTLHYSKGYYLHTVVLPVDRIASVKLRQSPIQFFDGKCDVLIHSFSEGSNVHHIRNLDRAAVKKLLGI